MPDINPRLPKASRVPARVIAPAPGWLFFLETLPVNIAIGSAAAAAWQKTKTSTTAKLLSAFSRQREKAAARVAAEQESLVQLSLDSHAPLPLEHLAYGWHVADGGMTYYATTRERLRQFLPETEKPLFLLPDFLFAPKPTTAGAWVWIATERALTAVRSTGTPIVTEVRSWELSEKTAKTTDPSANTETPSPAVPTPETEPAKTEPPETLETAHDAGKTLSQLWEQYRAELGGAHEPELYVWNGATVDRSRRNIVANWTTASGDSATATATVLFPVSEAWNADIRERAWLARERKTRAGLVHANRLLRAAAAVWLLLIAAIIALQIQGRVVENAALRSAQRQSEVNTINAQEEVLQRLDELQAGEITNPRNSFYDALAVCNQFRPQSILFTRATSNGKREITISGTANSVQEVSGYVESLRTKTTAFERVSGKTTHTAGGTNFDLTIVVHDLSDVTRGSPFSDEEQELIRSFLTPATSEKHDAGTLPPRPPAVPPKADNNLPTTPAPSR